MKHQIGRAEIKSIHGRKMRSSKTAHVQNYRTNPGITAPYQKNDTALGQRKSLRLQTKQANQLQHLNDQRQTTAFRAIQNA
mmetsp:Transcript_2005/g.2989  ORF Transcript_2005/g.2989 Transcript_2005/m.2989 type:complete len:81 (+) Transcript_2005:36-278(+)